MSSELKKTLSPLMLWGLGVGYVISGMYFGWNLGLKEGGTLGMAIATLGVIIMYTTFSFSYSELACSIPKAGGAFDYANKALGKNWGFIAGMAQVTVFVFAPPAIAFGIGAYLNLLFPQIPILAFAVGAYVIFTALNIYGVKAAASFEFAVTIIALGGLLFFAGITAPAFKADNLLIDSFPNGWKGAIAAIPFAIWFFLGIEGVANVAEESVNPQKDITKGFGSAMLTLVILCVMTFFCSVGVGGWNPIVEDASGNPSDSPLPLAIQQISSSGGLIYQALVIVGIFGLIASFNGLLLAAGRATFEMGRINYLPAWLGKIHPSFQTPHTALVFNMIIGIIALLTGKTGVIITISVLGALVLYVISMVSLVAYRRNEPGAHRPFRVPLYPVTPVTALCLAFFFLITMVFYYWQLAIVFFTLLTFSFLAFKIFVRPAEKESKESAVEI